MSKESEEQEGVLWGLADYAIHVPLSDKFYQTLQFQRVTIDDVLSGEYQHQPVYNDSRTYLRPIFAHLQKHAGLPRVFDVGGYIGRFSIEAALLFDELKTSGSIFCFEPGDTRELLRKNFALNRAANNVELEESAVSNHSGDSTFAIKDDAMISSRIVQGPGKTATELGKSWKETTVRTVALREYFNRGEGIVDAFVCKIDTEGHEAKVIEGIGTDNLENTFHALIVEFWPSLLADTIDGIPFGEYTLENYVIYDIRSSLYPRSYERINEFDRLVRELNSREVNNLDLLMIRKTTPRLDELLCVIDALGSTTA